MCTCAWAPLWLLSFSKELLSEIIYSVTQTLAPTLWQTDFNFEPRLEVFGSDVDIYALQISEQHLLFIIINIQKANRNTVIEGARNRRAQFADIIKRQFDRLYQEGEESGRVMCISIHPALMGQSQRAKYLSQALEHIWSFDHVWHATGREIAELSRGSFIAEMSFLSGDPASADVQCGPPVETITWSQENLANLKKLNFELWIKIQHVLSKDLVGKVRRTSSLLRTDEKD